MSFLDAVKSGFRHYADFSGRARRKEFWYWYLFTVLVQLAISPFYISELNAGKAMGFAQILYVVFALVILLPTLALYWRRLHDIGKSGALFFISLVPLVGGILLLIWVCRDSEPGDNIYGPNPKSAELVDVAPPPPYTDPQ